jgi:hypothetical protein
VKASLIASINEAFAFLTLQKGVPMFWLFLLLILCAEAFIRLGLLSAWVTVLSLTLKSLLAIALSLGLLYLWRRYRQ